jgi:predicted NBD/HSP70 family sugar kinase
MTRVLVIDVGGTHVKLKVPAARRSASIRFGSGNELGPDDMARTALAKTARWRYDAVVVGYPGPVEHGVIVRDPHNLGAGWVGFDFAKTFGKPVRLINDAAMQALGSYEGERMLFLGLGTGLGSATVDQSGVTALELAHLPYRHNRTFEDYLGERGYDRLGRKKWERHVHVVAELLRSALLCDYVVLGGGNVRRVRRYPARMRRGDNANAFVGGQRWWEMCERQPEVPAISRQEASRRPKRSRPGARGRTRR